MTKKIICCLLTLTLISCEKYEPKESSITPMIQPGMIKSGQILKLYTYEDKEVMYPTLEKVDDLYFTDYKNVFVNEYSQFVFRSGDPIRDTAGYKLLWDSRGYIRNTEFEKVAPSSVFTVDKKPIPNNAAVWLPELYSD